MKYQISETQLDNLKRQAFWIPGVFITFGLLLLLTLEHHSKPGAESTAIFLLCAGVVFLYLANNKKQHYETIVRHFRYEINSGNIEVTYSSVSNSMRFR